jgi:hypothetical protein
MGKVAYVKDGLVHFEPDGESERKTVMITKLRQNRLKDLVSRRLAKEA